MFPINSRYGNVPVATYQSASGTPIAYVRRRFVPPPERFDLLQEHAVAQGERLDQIAALHLGDPEQYWRIADANGAMQPDALTTPFGRRLRITLPEGIPGAPNA